MSLSSRVYPVCRQSYDDRLTLSDVLYWKRDRLQHTSSPSSAFLLPLLRVVSISGQPRRAYYKFLESKQWSVGGDSSFAVAGPSLWNSLPAALRRPEMTLHTFKRQLKAYLFHIWCVDEQKEHPPPPGAVVAFFVILGPDTKLPTYLLISYHQNLTVKSTTV